MIAGTMAQFKLGLNIETIIGLRSQNELN